MHIIIVGGGNVGFYLAKKLLQSKHTVVLIEKNAFICRQIVEELDMVVIQGDGCNPKCLIEAGIENADVIASVTSSDEDNLIISQLSKENFKIARTVTKVNDPQKEQIFYKLGVDVCINSTLLISKIIEEEVSFDDIVNLMTFKRGNLTIVRVDLSDTSPVINKQIKEIEIPENSVIVSILRDNNIIIPKGNTFLEVGDDIIALTKIETEKELLKALIGKI
ncbi:MAG: NAD-binding protein [bacterium]